ncbi:hypothetical protein AABB24_020699, partial [Solanum stoloniferum]
GGGILLGIRIFRLFIGKRGFSLFSIFPVSSPDSTSPPPLMTPQSFPHSYFPTAIHSPLFLPTASEPASKQPPGYHPKPTSVNHFFTAKTPPNHPDPFSLYLFLPRPIRKPPKPIRKPDPKPPSFSHFSAAAPARSSKLR